MGNILTQITDYLLTQSWHVAMLALVIGAVSVLLRNRSAHIRYLLWVIILGKCLVPPLLTMPLAILPQEQMTEPVAAGKISFEAEDAAVIVELDLGPADIAAEVSIIQRLRVVSLHQWLAFGWIVGASLFFIIALIKAFRVNVWLVGQRKPVSGELQVRIEEFFGGLGIKRFPKVWLVDDVGQPFVWGLVRGSIYLPGNFKEKGSRENSRGVLGHELSHVLRFDASVNLLQIIAQGIFWFHPFVWWANKKIRAEREKCCDEMAIARLDAKAKDYSSAIVDVLVAEYESLRPIPSLAIAGPVKNIEDRIKTIMKPGRKFYKRPSVVVVIAVVLLAVLAVPTTLALTRRPGRKIDVDVKTENVNDNEQNPVEYKGQIIREMVKKSDLEIGVEIEPAETQPVVLVEKAEPRIKFEEIYHNFGDVGPGTTNVCEFKFTNTGDSLLKITKVSKTCGCTPYTLEKKEYAPGENGTLKAKYVSAKRPGLVSRRLYVYSNDETEPKATLTLRANVVLKIDYQPNTMQLLLRDENAGCPEIKLSSVDEQPFAITELKSTSNSITADYDPAMEATSFVLRPKVDIEKLQKSSNGYINISLTHPECKTVLIPFKALSEFKVSPSVISVFNVEPQKPVTRKLWVLNNYGEDFEVESASSEKGTIKVLHEEKVGRRYKFELEIMPPVAEDNKRIFTDEFIVNTSGGKWLQVPCRMFYATRPEKKTADMAEIQIDTRFIVVRPDNDEIKDFLESEDFEFVQAESNLMTYLPTAEQVDELLRLVQADAGSKMFSSPKVKVFDSETATMRVQRTVRYISGYSEPNEPLDEPEPKYDEFLTGVVLQVKPKLEADTGNILVKHDYEVSDITGYEKHTYKGKYSYEIPVITAVKVSTMYMAKNGQTLLLGGQKINTEKDGEILENELFVLIKAEQVEQ
jgi:beta-lactamase regulating signal transducer with metallopeptidase domain